MEVITQIQGGEESQLIPFFLVHAISGLAVPYLHLESLSDNNERPVYGITSPLHCAVREDFTFPSTLRELAEYYIREIRMIQSHGPYLLGGWSMGGMIAMNMAHILQAQGEKVLKVIMVDSGNPEAFPSVADPAENRAHTQLLFSRILNTDGGARINALSPISSPFDSEIEEHDFFSAKNSRTSTWDISTPRSSSSSLSEDDEGPFWTPGQASDPATCASAQFCSPADSDCESVREKLESIALEGKYDALDGDSDLGDDENDGPQLNDCYHRIKVHIHKGLQLISDVKPGELLPTGTKSDFHAVLVKCKAEPQSGAKTKEEELEGAQILRGLMRENGMRWDMSRFAKFETISFSGEHDNAFAPEYVGELSEILRKCLVDVQ